MFWADQITSQIITSGKYRPYHVDDMKTPSGRVHVGALRGVIIHDLLFKCLLEQGKKAIYTYVFNDMDPMDGFPAYLPEKFRQHMGKPLFQIPSPEAGYPSLARCFGEEFIRTFNRLGAKPDIIWSSEWYKNGKFNQVIKESLDKVKKIRHLYKKISHYDKPGEWYPFQVICPNCGKVGTTIVTDWDGIQVTYQCQTDLVKWAKGCGYTGKISPYNGTGKLMWKVDWAAHWKVIRVTIEGAGKDHMTEGGSHDLSSAICEQAFNYPTPFTFLYEWFLARGGLKMSSSKGVGSSAKEISDTLPPEILRFLLVRMNYQKAIIIDPNNNESLLDLFDEYDRFAESYYSSEKNMDDFGRIWQMSQVGAIPETKPFYPRFRDVVNFVQNPAIDIKEQVAKQKGKSLTAADLVVLDERIKYAKVWLKNYAPKEAVFQVSETIPAETITLTKEQKTYLKEAAKLINTQKWNPEKLQQALYELSKKQNLPAKMAFQAIYLSLLGKTHGPKAGWLLLDQDKEFIAKRFLEVGTSVSIKAKEEHIYPVLDRPELFTIDQTFKHKYPSIAVGLAIIRGVKIAKTNSGLLKEIDDFIKTQGNLTTQDIGAYPEIQSYRRIYKETGVDWHSKRPSPEGLLRRIILKKGLYNINTCVDAYNLIVMKYRVSAGAFDLDRVKFPTVLRFARKGDQIVLLGDKKPTYYQEGEVAYFDKVGGYNIDFNYLDAERTKVTEKTKNLWINIDGIYDISRQQVEQTLKEVIRIITKYCGGKVELAGIVR